jgi:hypothetical protein
MEIVVAWVASIQGESVTAFEELPRESPLPVARAERPGR